MEFWKSIYICQSYYQASGDCFSWRTLFTFFSNLPAQGRRNMSGRLTTYFNSHAPEMNYKIAFW